MAIKQLIEYVRRLFALRELTEKNSRDVALLQEQVEALTSELRLLRLQIAQDRELAERDRENLILRLENALLRQGRELPAARPGELPSD